MLVALLLLGPWILAPGAAAWRQSHDRLGMQRDRLAEDLGSAHAVLLSRARVEQPALIPRLSQEPPMPRPRGYRIVPEIQQDGPVAPTAPREESYSLERLAGVLESDLRAAATLGASASVGSPLEPKVAEFERLRKRLRNVEEHLDYHEFWQRAIVEQPAFFAERNRLVARARELDALRRDGGTPHRIAELSRGLHERVAPFIPTPGHAIEAHENGLRVLPVVVHTDIEDDAFLAVFQDAVESLFTRTPTARALRFTIELEIRRVSPATLYPQGAPERGAEIEMPAHLARFPAGALILTTGNDSTHAWTGHYIALGPGPLTRRTLVHEFAHLLGFQDAYLRGYDRDPHGPYGAILVEWVGLTDDLMGNPENGRVTRAMIQTLLEQYAQREDSARAGRDHSAPK